MDFCRVTELLTDNKWKGQFVHKYVIRKAKDMMKNSLIINNRGITMRQAIISIQNSITKRTDEKHTVQERVDMLNEILKIRR